MGDIRIQVECKTGKPDEIQEGKLRRFLQRANLFKPDIALLLIDSDSSIAKVVARINNIISDLAWKDARLDNPNLPDDAILKLPTLAAQTGRNELYWGMRNVYVTNTEESIDASLTATLRLYDSEIRHHSFWGGDNVWDFINGTVTPKG